MSKRKLDLEKTEPRSLCFKPTILTKNVNYNPSYQCVEKKSTQNFAFDKMVGRSWKSNSSSAILSYAPRYDAVSSNR